jgi:hypothetical protein
MFLCKFFKSLLASASNSLLIVIFKVLQAPWGIAIESFLNLRTTLIVTVNCFFNGTLTADYTNCTQIFPMNQQQRSKVYNTIL